MIVNNFVYYAELCSGMKKTAVMDCVSYRKPQNT